jgi:hypothetical protein
MQIQTINKLTNHSTVISKSTNTFSNHKIDNKMDIIALSLKCPP